MTNPEWLKRAAQRSAQEPWMLGHVFKRYLELEGRSDEALAQEVGCTLEVLHWLSLCRRPVGEAFTEQVFAIAKRFAVEPTRLLAVLRRVEVMETLAAGSAGEEGTDEDALLIAARDRSQDDEKNS